MNKLSKRVYIDSSIYGDFYGPISELIEKLKEVEEQVPKDAELYADIEAQEDWGSVSLKWAFYYHRPETDSEAKERIEKYNLNKKNRLASLEKLIKELKKDA